MILTTGYRNAAPTRQKIMRTIISRFLQCMMHRKLHLTEALSTLIMVKEDLCMPAWFFLENYLRVYPARFGYLPT